MGFLPYGADLDLYRIPVVTILVSLLCLTIYFFQERSSHAFTQETWAFCEEHRPRLFRMALKDITGAATPAACAALMTRLHRAEDRRAFLDEAIEGEDSFQSRAIDEQYQRFAARLPAPLTERLWYEPASWNPLRMITATVAHGSWLHVIGNLYFFFAFAVTVELVIGWWRFILAILGIGLGTGVAYTLANLGADDALPTVGLSGVVMGMMALFVYFLPSVGIRCVLWLVVWFKRVVIPSWILFLWYFGWDLYNLQAEGTPGVNLVAHVSGAVIGAALGFLFFSRQRREISLLRLAQR